MSRPAPLEVAADRVAARHAVAADAAGLPKCIVAVLDTGITNALRASVQTTGVYDEEHCDNNHDGVLDPYAGHGTFIAGLVHHVAPGAEVVLHRAVRSFGDVDDAELAMEIEFLLYRIGRLNPAAIAFSPDVVKIVTKKVLDDLVADLKAKILTSNPLAYGAVPLILNLSISGYSSDDDRPVATAEVIRNLLFDKGYRRTNVSVVASAGNSSAARPTWPASFDEVISVGALDGSGPAWFTNFGPWVQACAPGTDLHSRFFDSAAEAEIVGDPRITDVVPYNGWATWSGTSFAAPIVAASLAWEVMTASVDPSKAEVRLILDPGLVRSPGLGTIVNAM